MDNVTFASKIDGWLLAILSASAGVCLVAAGLLAVTGGAGAWLIAAMIVALGTALPLWVLSTTHYTLTASELHVRSGPFRWRVRLNEIREVVPTRNPLSGPALSLDRLRVDYGRSGSIMISPRDKEGFLRALKARREAYPPVAADRGGKSR